MTDRARILVVDTDLHLLKWAHDHLPQFDVETTDDALDALGRLLCNHYDLVLLEFALPLVDGTEFLHIVRSNPLFKHMPVVVMSACPEAGRQFAKDADSSFVAKPFSISTLLNYVTDALKPLAASLT